MMPEKFESKELNLQVYVDAEYEKFVPLEFRLDPFGYFEKKGKNVKSGEIRRDDSGRVRDDPTAVKDMTWVADDGSQIEVVGKKVNIKKGHVAKTNNPLHEFTVLTRAHEFNLPCAKPIARAENGDEHLLVTERIKGFRLSSGSKIEEILREKRFDARSLADFKAQAEEIMTELQKKFEGAGIIRTWALKDMVVDVDFENKKIISLIPTDWERTKLIEPKSEKLF